MAEFQYKAADSSGKIDRSTISAPDRKIAAAKLASRGLRVLELKSLAQAASSSAKINAGEVVKIKGGDELVLAFIKKLLQLCQGGMPMGDALKSLAGRSLNPNMKNLSKELYKSVSEGASLATAMSAYPKLFEPSIIHLSEAGESTANYVPVFRNIIQYLEGKKALRASVIKALAYPSLLCAMAFGVVLFFIFFLMPMIEGMMQNLGGEVNLAVKILMWLGDFIIYYGPIILLLIFVFSISIYKWRTYESGRLKTDKILLKLPMIGEIVKNTDISRFTNLMSTLFSSGVNTTEVFRLAEKTINNTALRARFQQCKIAINDGAPIALSFKKNSLLDDDDIDILSVGERTGSLIDSFNEIYKMRMEILESKINMATTTLTVVALVSAVLIIFLVAIGIVFSVYGLTENIL